MVTDNPNPEIAVSKERQHEDRIIPLLNLAVLLAENRGLVFLFPLLAGIAAIALSFLVAPTYTGITRILPPIQQQNPSGILAAQLGALAGLVGSASGIKNPTDQYAALLRSQSVENALV